MAKFGTMRRLAVIETAAAAATDPRFRADFDTRVRAEFSRRLLMDPVYDQEINPAFLRMQADFFDLTGIDFISFDRNRIQGILDHLYSRDTGYARALELLDSAEGRELFAVVNMVEQYLSRVFTEAQTAILSTEARFQA